MALDGNLISKGAGEGEAYMFQPFQVDTHTIDQMNQNLVQQADRRIKEQQAKQAAEADKKAKLEQMVFDTYKYDPLDDAPMKKLHKEALDAIYNGEDDRTIKEKVLGLSVFANDSLNTFKKRSEIDKLRREQGDTNWFVGEDEYNAGALTPNEASDLGAAAQNLQARQMALDKFQVGAPKIKNIPEFVQKTASAIPPIERKSVGQYTDASGQIQTKYENIYDPKVVDDVASVAYQTYGRDLAPVYKTEEDFKNYFKQYTNPKPTISGKFPPTSSANKGWSNSNGRVSNGKLAISEPINVRALNSVSREEAWKKYAEATKGNKKAKDHDTFMAEYVAKDTPVMLYPLKSLKAGGDNPEMDFIGGSGNKVRGKMLGQTMDGSMIGVKDKNGVITLVPSDLNQAFFNTHDTNSQEITEQTTNFKGADTKMIGDKGKVVEVKAEKGGKQKEYIIKGKKYSDSDVANAAKQSNMTVQEYLNALNSIK